MKKMVSSFSMIIKCTIFIACVSQTLQTSTEQNRLKCERRVSACENSEGAKRQVCGTDNQTYPSRCHLQRAQCRGDTVSLRHKGQCTDNRPCFASLNYALSKRSSTEGDGADTTTFVPKCRQDGDYAPIQCHSQRGCWCVTPQGKPLPDTSVRNGRPKCRSGNEKSFTRRRSSVRGQRNKKGCSRADREQFNQNLVKLLTNEYDRVRSMPPQGTDKQMAVIEWKYSDLDKDSSGTMQKIEYRELRRLVKKVVKPKRCAKTFIRVCDKNRDEIISKQEWANCLTSEGLNYEEDVDQEDDLGLPETSEADYNEDYLGPMGVLQGSVNKIQTLTDLEEPVEHQSKDETEAETNDCLSDRKGVLDEQKNGDTVLYVPECTTDGRYQKVQCYHSTGYCWCVHEDTGKPIPGSSVKDQHPKCEALTAFNRPMKGCPDNKKTQFLRNLMDFLWSKMSSANGTVTGTSEIIKWQVSKEEQTAMWTFVMLDKDKNKVLERREWKSFHNLIISNQLLKRCGKKLPRFCDVNHDRKISITEWLGCLNAQRTVPANTSTLSPISTPASRRKGPNPLESILKAED